MPPLRAFTRPIYARCSVDDSEATELRLGSGEVVRAVLRLSGRRHKCILLHGNPRSLRDWRLVLQSLASTADVAAIDLPGFGHSARPRAGRPGLSLERLADVVAAVADALSWHAPVFVAGHSHGGGVAQMLAANYPSRVAGIVLLGTLGSPAHSSYRLLAAPGAAAVTRAFGAALGPSWLRPVVQRLMNMMLRDGFWPEPVPAARTVWELEQFAARPEVLASMVDVSLGRPCDRLLASAASIRCPVMFLHGEVDHLVPVECARTIHRQIQQAGGDSRFEVLPGAGHMLLEFQAADVAARMAQFMQTVDLKLI